MIYDLQRASMWRRVSAWLLDAILLCVTATMVAWLLSIVLNYDSYQQRFDARYAHFEAEYGVSRNVTQEEVDAMTPEQLANLEAASVAFSADPEALYACLNFGEAYCPRQIEDQAVCLDGDIGETLQVLADSSSG